MGSDNSAEMRLLKELQGGDGGGEGFDPQRILQLVLRNIWLILGIVAVGTTLSWVYVKNQPKIYASWAKILVDQEENAVIKFDFAQNTALQSQEFINTAVDSFTSTKLLARAVRSSGLDRVPGFMQPRQDGQDFNDIELANRFRYMVHASLRPNTRFIDVIVEDTDPERAKVLATALVNEFIKEMIEQRDSTSNYERDFLLEEVERLKAQLGKSELELQAYREQHPDLTFDDDGSASVNQLSDLNARVTTAKAERLKVESALATLANANMGDLANIDQIGEIAAIAELPDVTKTQDKLVEAQNQLDNLRVRYGSEYPEVIKADRLVGELKRSLAGTLSKSREMLQQRYEAAVETESKLSKALADQRAKALTQNRLAIRYNVLSREVKSDRDLCEDAIKQLKESTVRNGVKQIPFHIIEFPISSNVPIRPDPRKIVVLGFTMSLFLAVGLIVLIDRVFNTFRTADEAEKVLELFPLASIPDASPVGSGLVMRDDPHSIVAEGFRTMRAQLFLRKQDADRRVFLFTSANPGEGKSFTALNCAAAFAQQGLRTVLVEADVRRPGIARQLSPTYAKAKGLTDYLERESAIADVVIETELAQLFLLPAGTPKPNPAELLSQPAMGELLRELDRTYDRVVIDTAPINPVSDTLLLARQVDAVCLVIQAGKTPQQLVKRTLSILRKAGSNVAGFVMNRTARSFRANQSYYYDALLRR
jgi:capsular exopolysaccharide synthesis family protein